MCLQISDSVYTEKVIRTFQMWTFLRLSSTKWMEYSKEQLEGVIVDEMVRSHDRAMKIFKMWIVSTDTATLLENDCTCFNRGQWLSKSLIVSVTNYLYDSSSILFFFSASLLSSLCHLLQFSLCFFFYLIYDD